MQPKFAKAVDPIFVAALRFESKIENRERIVTADEKALLIRKIDEAEGMLGLTEEWKLAKYALCSWIDSRLISLQWAENEWWKNNCLEMRYFGTRDAHEEFFVKATQAASHPSKNALEVFYVAVVLGFEGFYASSDLSYCRQVCSKLRIPPNLESWCRETVRSLHLRQGRPTIPGMIQSGHSAKPLDGRASLQLFSMLSILFVALAIVCYWLLFVPTEGTPSGASMRLPGNQLERVTHFSPLGNQR